MKTTRHDLIELLQCSAETPAPDVDPVFAAQLERRLQSIDLTPTTAVRRRRPAHVALTAIVAVTAFAGVAAAASAIVTSLRHTSTPPATTTPTIDTTPPTTVATSPSVTTTSVTVTASSKPVVAPLPPAATTLPTPPTTLPETTVPETTLVSVTVAPATTEVRTAVTMSLQCTSDPASISCTWNAGPPGTTHYAVLRGEAAANTGRVFTPEPGSTTYVDTLASSGSTYSYVIHALDDAGQSLGRSDGVFVTCCG